MGINISISFIVIWKYSILLFRILKILYREFKVSQLIMLFIQLELPLFARYKVTHFIDCEEKIDPNGTIEYFEEWYKRRIYRRLRNLKNNYHYGTYVWNIA